MKGNINRYHITDAEARQLEICPACDSKKRKGLIVCWDCFKSQPKTSTIVMPGYKHWNGSLTEFVATSNIPF